MRRKATVLCSQSSSSNQHSSRDRADAISCLRLPDWMLGCNCESFSLSLFLLIPVCLAFFFGVLLLNLRKSSFQIGKRLDPPQTFGCIYICPGAGISLTFSLPMPKESSTPSQISGNFIRIVEAESAEKLPLNPSGFPSPTAHPL